MRCNRGVLKLARRFLGPKCFVVSMVRCGLRLYLKRFEEEEIEGAALPILKGYFVPDLVEALKFPTESEAHFFADRFDGAEVEIIKKGEVLK